MNGTFVNGIEVKDQISLIPGDCISVLDSSFDIFKML